MKYILRHIERLSHTDILPVAFLICLVIFPFDWFNAAYASEIITAQENTDTIVEARLLIPVEEAVNDTVSQEKVNIVTADDYPYGFDGKRIFNARSDKSGMALGITSGIGTDIQPTILEIANHHRWIHGARICH